MEHPYRVHSSIGFGFLQLLMLSSLAYPIPPPPLYHNIALIRMMGTVYFTLFQNNPVYLKLECLTILFEVIKDGLYVSYVIKDYTYIFGVIDITSNLIFCTIIVLSLNNGHDKWESINNSLEGIRQTCINCCWKKNESQTHHDTSEYGAAKELERKETIINTKSHVYTSLPTNENVNGQNKTAVYTFGSRQAFKPSFYSSSWGRDYLNANVEREFERIEHKNTYNGDIGIVTSSDGSTQYIRFDDSEPTSYTSAAHHYANIFVSPYFMKDGTPFTSFSSWTKKDTVSVFLFTYNLVQFIYQLILYNSIIKTCQEYHKIEKNETNANDRLMRWLC